MTTAEMIQKARDVGVLSPDKEAVEVTITVPGYKTVRVTVPINMALNSPHVAARLALDEAIHATSDPDLWHAARKTAAA